MSSSSLTSGTILGDGRYLLQKPLGSGSHGDVYFGKDLNSEEEVAIKLESWDVDLPCLFHENLVYKALEGGLGFPTSRWFNQEQRHNVMVMDLLGPSLEGLFAACGNRFTLKTVVLVADQLLDRVQFLHEKRFIHRSIKPENFSVGRYDASLVYMIDFGNTKKYMSKSGVHIKCKVYTELGLSNCHSRHQSIGALQRMERSRRDDLESLGYMLIYFLRGKLPWDAVMHNPEELKKIKMGTSVEELCEGCPAEFTDYMGYVRGLEFIEAPDYSRLRLGFRNLAKRMGIEYDGKFDWIPQEKHVDKKMFSASGIESVKVQER